MKPFPRWGITVAACLAAVAGCGFRGGDLCLGRTPPDLRRLLLEKFPGERLSITGNTDGFFAGTVESSACAYFLRDGKWFHVWFSD